jgi:CheY-like chemotaxis protein
MSYENIMLIDDDEDDREIFQSALALMELPVTCTAFPSAVEALEYLTGGRISPDVIFLDLNMPLMNGHEFLGKIKIIEALRSIPIIIFSTSRNPLSIMQSKEAGAIDYITKPYTLHELVRVLQRILIA